MVEAVAEGRQSFIGGSDAAAVLGVSRWGTPLQVWAEKTGNVNIEHKETLPMRVGKLLEDAVCDLFCQETGKAVRRVNDRVVHKDYPFLQGQIDRRIVGEDAFLEAKTCSAWKAKEWAGEEIPQEYIVQCMHDLAVTGMRRAYVAVLIGGNQDFKWKVVERDPVAIAELVKKEVTFWNNFIVPKIMPGIVTKDDAQVLYQLFPNPSTGSAMLLSDQANALCERRQALLQDKQVCENELDKIDNELKALLGETERGESSRWRVSWLPQVTRRLDTAKLKATEPRVYEQYLNETRSRVLRVKEVTNGDTE